jgi:hypothetical protein
MHRYLTLAALRLAAEDPERAVRAAAQAGLDVLLQRQDTREIVCNESFKRNGKDSRTLQ